MCAAPVAPSRLVVGTAGHVDHGKTALVRMLTGVDTDRLPEEKARGISIELGFAPLPLGDGRRAALVDVPGHERFLHTMVAGVTGIDLVLLVVAADEGVMPQTREHVDVCALLGVRRGLVALTKLDATDPELRGLASDEVRAALRGTFLERAPLVPCSSLTGEGRAALWEALTAATRDLPTRPTDGPARLPLDRVFTVKGAGTVVTGTMASGRLQEGEPVVVLPGGAAARVRGIEVHGEARAAAWAGERAALNLTGVDRAALTRGATLAAQGAVPVSSCLDVELTWLPVVPAPLARRARLLFHALTTQENAEVALLGAERLAPGATGFARVHLERPVALLPGDRVLLRGFRALPGHGTTVGGGRVIRLLGLRQPRRDPTAAETVTRMAVATAAERVLLEIATAPTGLARAEALARTGLGGAVVDELVAAGRVALLGREHLVAPPELERIEEALAGRVEALGVVSRETLRTSLPAVARLPAPVFAALLERLAASGRVTLVAEQVRPRLAPALDPAGAALLDRVAALLTAAELAPPPPRELALALGAEPAGTAQTLRLLVARGQAVRVGRELFFCRRAIDDLRARLRAFLVERGAITTQEMKALVGGTRRTVIPLAEHFDAERLTLRVGQVRRLRSGP